MISPPFRSSILFLLVGLLAMTGPSATATEDGRHAIFNVRIGPDGSRTAFTHAGDIWIADLDTGGCARVTDHVGYDHHPVWFPDGARLAFTSNRDGNDDIYSVGVTGGAPIRHTWHGSYDVVSDISPDGEHILFRSWRGMYSSDLYEVDIHGGLPRPLTRDESVNREASYSFDGSKMCVCRGGPSWTRRHYRGSGDTDIYVMNRDGSNPHWVENGYDGMDYWPFFSPDENHIFFVSDREFDCANLYRIPSEGGPVERLTGFRDRPVHSPSIARTGRICFEQDFRLWVMDSPSDTPRMVELQLASEPKHSQEVRLGIGGHITEMRIGPDGSLMALIARGELYITQIHDPDTTAPLGDTRYWESIRITSDSSRERNVTWHPDGDKVALVSDKDGNQEIYEIDLRTNEWTRLTRTREDEHGPDYSPDGNFLAYFRGNREMIVRNLETGDDHVVAEALFIYYPYWENFFWSPDSKWIAYTLNDARYFGDVYILPIDEDGSGGDAVNITLHHDHDSLMGWSADGESIYFMSNRKATLGLNTYGSWRMDTGLYMVPLKRTPPPRSDVLEFPEEPEEPDEAESSGESEDEEAENEEESEPEIEIHFDRIEERARLVSPTRGAGWVAALSPDCSTFVYSSDALGTSALWTVPFEGGSATHMVDAGSVTDLVWDPDGKGFFFLDGGKVKFCDANSGKVTNVPMHGRLTVDLMAERLQMISETGRLLRNNFYDEDMHGMDWEDAVEYYTPFVAEATVAEEFDLLMEMLFGELDASHLGFWGASSHEGIGSDTAFLGLDFDPTTTGPGLLVTRAWPRGPADYEETRIEPGEWVLEINGIEVSTSNNYLAVLDDAGDRTTVLTVASDQDGADTREVAIGPVPYLEGAPYGNTTAIMYVDWAEQKRAIVDEATDGRIGYIHLPHMMGAPLELFARQLFSENFDKDALIVDVRWNSGGNIHEALLDILSRPQFGWMQNRDQEEWIEQPSRRWDRPIVVLINERSFSDAEIFPQGIRALGLATLMGETTFGGVIGTVNIRLVDGERTIRIPRVGWYTIEGENMENLGVEPDIRILNDLAHIRDGIDDQLNAAIEYLLVELE